MLRLKNTQQLATVIIFHSKFLLFNKESLECAGVFSEALNTFAKVLLSRNPEAGKFHSLHFSCLTFLTR